MSTGHTISAADKQRERIDKLAESISGLCHAVIARRLGQFFEVIGEEVAKAPNEAVFAEMLALCIDMREWLKPELLKEPDRSFFWRLVEVIRKAEGKPSLFDAHLPDEQKTLEK